MSADESTLEIEALFMRFIHTADVSELLDNAKARERLKGKRWGWLVHDDASALHAGFEPFLGIDYMGIHETEKEAVDAAVSYIWKKRGDLVKECSKERAKGRAYRTSRANGLSGSHIF